MCFHLQVETCQNSTKGELHLEQAVKATKRGNRGIALLVL